MRFSPALFNLLLLLLFLLAGATTGCFTELRSITCSDESDCFSQEDEICFEGRCRRQIQPDAGTEDIGPQLVEITGSVSDKDTLVSIPGARVCDVQPGGDSVIVHSDGTYFLGIESGTIRASHPDYQSSTVELAPSTPQVHFELEPCESSECEPTSTRCPGS